MNSHENGGIKKMNQKNKDFKEKREMDFKKKKIRRIYIGIIIALFIGTVIGACEGSKEINRNWTTVQYQKLYMDYKNDLLNYTEYQDRREVLAYETYLFEYYISLVSNSVKVFLNIAFILIIIGLLSITIDQLFNKKMRRISLIMAITILLFMTYSIFISNVAIQQAIFYYT
ncbi:hypothetical protein ES703_109525 [subsurface metagenome]